MNRNFISETLTWLKTTCGCDAHAASSDRHAVFVLLDGVQHAQSDCQLPLAVCNDGVWKLAALILLIVVSQDVLVREETRRALMSFLFKPKQLPRLQSLHIHL